jgi:hypothetical protein
MKWIQSAPGSYKLVDDTDERPAVKLPHKKYGPIHTPFIPSWKKYEEAMRHPDSKQQGVATDKFMAERDHALRTDPQAKKYEESRKARWAADKPQWIKENS